MPGRRRKAGGVDRWVIGLACLGLLLTGSRPSMGARTFAPGVSSLDVAGSLAKGASTGQELNRVEKRPGDVDALPMSVAFDRERRDAVDAVGPAARAWDTGLLFRRQSAGLIPDFGLASDVDGGRVWRCATLRLRDAVPLGGNASLLQTSGRAMRVSVPLRLSPAQEMGMSLLTVGERLASLARGKALHGTIFETIIHPIQNALAAISPKLAYFLGREIIVILLSYILKWMMLDAVMLPSSASMNPSLVADPNSKVPQMNKARASLGDMTQLMSQINAFADADSQNDQRTNDRLGGNGLGNGGLGAGSSSGSGSGTGQGTGGGDDSTNTLGQGSSTEGQVRAGPWLGLDAEQVLPDPSVHWGPSPNRAGHLRSPMVRKDRPTSLLQTGARLIPVRDVGLGLSLRGMGGKVGTAVAATVSPMLVARVRETLRVTLLPLVARTVSRRLVESLVPRATASASLLLVREVTKQLLGRDRLRSKIVARVSQQLVGRLTQGLTAAIAQAVSRDPSSDHLCFLCAQKQLYCSECQRSRDAESLISWRALYFGRYYAAYHTAAWASVAGW
jgi:hypothetical protein